MPRAFGCCKKTTLSGGGMLPKNNTHVAKKQHIVDGGGRERGNVDRLSCHSSFVIIMAKTRF
jgi:hypothetical protein